MIREIARRQRHMGALLIALMAFLMWAFVAYAQGGGVGDTRSDSELWIAVAAVLTSVASGLILKYGSALPDLAKQGIVLVVAVVLTVGGNYFAGTLDLIDWPRTAMIVFLGATGVYVVLWEAVAKPVMARM